MPIPYRALLLFLVASLIAVEGSGQTRPSFNSGTSSQERGYVSAYLRCGQDFPTLGITKLPVVYSVATLPPVGTAPDGYNLPIEIYSRDTIDCFVHSLTW